jgi:iron(III) transport system permease protein
LYAYCPASTTAMRLKAFSSPSRCSPFLRHAASAVSFIYIFSNQELPQVVADGSGDLRADQDRVVPDLLLLPHAVLILTTALSLADQRLYEAAAAMGTSSWRTFFTVTLPGVRFGIISASFVIFTLVITDFGIAKVIGGQFSVLATDAYKQVVGQHNVEMGAVVGFVLLVPALLAFAVDRIVQRRQVARSRRQCWARLGSSPWSPALYCVVVGGLITGGRVAVRRRSSPTAYDHIS